MYKEKTITHNKISRAIYNLTKQKKRSPSLWKLNSLAKTGEHELQIVCMQALHQTNIGCINKGTFENGLQQAVWCHLYHHSTFRYMSESFLEEDRRQKIVHMVCSWRILCQCWVPGWFRDRRTDPARCALLRVGNDLQHIQGYIHYLNAQTNPSKTQL